jgi:hypothetical protein
VLTRRGGLCWPCPSLPDGAFFSSSYFSGAGSQSCSGGVGGVFVRRECPSLPGVEGLGGFASEMHGSGAEGGSTGIVLGLTASMALKQTFDVSHDV